jgi:hypothetical protein
MIVLVTGDRNFTAFVECCRRARASMDASKLNYPNLFSPGVQPW